MKKYFIELLIFLVIASLLLLFSVLQAATLKKVNSIQQVEQNEITLEDQAKKLQTELAMLEARFRAQDRRILLMDRKLDIANKIISDACKDGKLDCPLDWRMLQ